ncbi:F-box protein CPR1 [Jatropha curcas]|uniref:F-box protein CPR1 n=1 Tax=Jatropha curcas TaxID=180498 RepID=UPI0005FB8CF1|nr:F-box protein CPR1 [Jatropha curcas]
MSLLPEIIFDILLRLPVKPLLRFRCLSKVMFCTIDDSDFIKAHLNRSIETNTHKKLILVSRRQTFPVLCTLDFDDGMKERVKLDDPLNHSHRWWAYRVLGCCNGLILLYVDIIKKLILWNPFTKRHKILKAHANESLRRYDGFGLGYDAASNDYRIVVVPYKMPKEVWIYSLRCNSWKKVDGIWFELHLCDLGMFVNGVLYFGGKYLDKIVAFDITTETFCTYPLPQTSRFSNNLCVLEGKLCFYTCTRNGTIEIYVGDKQEDGLTWSKLTTIRSNSILCETPLFYSREGNKVLVFEEDNNVVWCDLNENGIERVKTVNDIKKHYQVICFNYSSTTCWESLVSLGHDSRN